MTATHEQVADTFLEILSEWFTEEEKRECNRRHAQDEYDHFSDFCDGNIAMESAMERNGVPVWTKDGHINEATCDFWNEAWAIAVRKGFAL